MKTLIHMLTLSEKAHKIIGFIGFLFICLFFTYNFYFGERIHYNCGWGFDGVYYAQKARTDPVLIIKEKHLSEYYARRMLPSFVVHYASKVVGFSLGEPAEIIDKIIEEGRESGIYPHLEDHVRAGEPERVISAFYIYNCVLLLLGVWIWSLIAKEYKWSPSVRLLSFVALFMNYQVLKFSIYYPILTDISGMVMGIFVFYLYITDRLLALVLISFIASFMWPPIVYTVLPLILFKIQKLQPLVFNSKGFSNWVVGIFSVSFICITIYLSYSPGNFLSRWGYSIMNTEILILSAPLMALYIFLGLRNFVDLSYIFSQIRNTNLFRILLACSLLFSVKAVASIISNDHPSPFGTIDYLFFACRYGMLLPLGNVVFHVLDYGPAVLFIIFLWKDFVQVVKENGVGLMLFVCLYTFLAMGSESRQYISAWPVFAILICEVLNRRDVAWPFVLWVSALSLTLSRFWLAYNENTWTGVVFNFFKQKHLVTVASYVVFLCTIYIVTIYILPKIKRSDNIYLLKFTTKKFFGKLGNTLDAFTKMYKTPRVFLGKES